MKLTGGQQISNCIQNTKRKISSRETLPCLPMLVERYYQLRIDAEPVLPTYHRYH